MSAERRGGLLDALILSIWLVAVVSAFAGLGLQTHRQTGPPSSPASAPPVAAMSPAVATAGIVSDARFGIPQLAPAQLTTPRLPPNHTPGRVRAGALLTVVLLIAAGLWSKRRVLAL
jgi:hypothetical protein